MKRFSDDIQSYLTEQLDALLPPAMHTLMRQAVLLAQGRGWSAYLVGGSVRDALLGQPSDDVDISIVGDAVKLANDLGAQVNLEIEIAERFRTSTIHLDGGLHLDLVTARKETYPSPGALPEVEPGSIQDDLARRDFTINAMAVQLLPEGMGDLLDPHGGLDDLKAGLVRVLHDHSFRDDPTRIFRAIKIAERLGFRIENGTLELILQAIRDGALATVSMDRITRELLLILEEPKADRMLAYLDKLGVLRAIHPGLVWPYPSGRADIGEDATREQRRDTYLAILGAEQGTPEAAEQLARWLNLPVEGTTLMRDAARLMQLWPRLDEEKQPPSETYNLLNGLDVKALEAFARLKTLQETAAWQRLHLYLDTLRHVKPQITGDYLRELGVPPGPVYKQALDELLRAKLDGEVRTREDEERFVREWLAKKGVLRGGQ